MDGTTDRIRLMIAKRPTTEVRSGLDQRSNRKVKAERSRSIPLLKCLVLFLLVLNLCLLSAIFVSPRGVHGYHAQQAEVLRLAALTKRMAQDNQRLVSRIRHLKSDQVAQERMVKQELGWVHEDEIIVEFATPLTP
jgi:cell division protein FtsB